MAREYNLIQRADLQQRLARGLDIVGESSPARTLDPTVQAVVMLEDLTKQGSPSLQPVDRRALGCFPQAAVAGELSAVVLVNPASSGLVVVVDGIMLSTSVASTDIGIGRYATAGYALQTTGRYADTRNGGDSPIQIWGGSDAVSSVQQEFARVRVGSSGAGQSQFHVPHVVLLPGESFGCEHQAANASLSVGFTWLEYTP